jgi:hypothetical protein
MNPKIIFTAILVFVVSPAWAGQGWYLMMPPKAAVAGVSHTTTQAEFVRRMHETPLKNWDHWRSFDTARACEQKRDEWSDETKELFKQYGTDDSRLLHKAVSVARCIASDDPRLK